MKSLEFIFKSIEDLAPPCYVTLPTIYTTYGVTYILMGFDKEKQKYRLVSAKDPWKERFVSGDMRCVVGVKFETDGEET